MTDPIPPTACPVCTGRDIAAFFSQFEVPTQAGHLAPTAELARNCALGDITLQHCRDCAHIWNSSFDPAKVGFDANYDFSQYHSSAYRDYVSSSLERLIARYDLRDKTALDIACGKGEFLKMLVRAGFREAIGFDPTFVGGDFDDAERERITVHRKYYDRTESALRPGVVTCRSALQYMPEPREILQSIRETLDGSRETVVYFEVPNGAEAFRDGIVWYVMYEAGCFFSPASLARIFRECGFDVLDLRTALGSSHLEIEARPAADPRPYGSEAPRLIAEIQSQVDTFSATYESRITEWSERFDEFGRQGTRVALWASGMRAISLLVNVPASAEIVEAVVDVNPQRQGRYMPKTAQPVVGPEQLQRINPDVVICTNPNYAAEIEGQLLELGIDCEYLVLT